MSRLQDEKMIVPPAAWAIAGVVSVALAAGLMFITSRPNGPFFEWHEIPRVLFAIGLPVVMFVYIVLLGYVYGDARRRGMRAVMWVLLSIFIPNAIGFILYFILRNPILKPCLQCGKGIGAEFAFCPNCGASLAQTCPNCHRTVDSHWSHCAHCGRRLHN